LVLSSYPLLSRFRGDFYECLIARSDALFELTDAVVCADGLVKTLVGLAPAPEHRRGHGVQYAGVNQGWLDVHSLRRALVSVPIPKAADGRLVLAVDVSLWLRRTRAPPRTGAPATRTGTASGRAGELGGGMG
jgi:hypothetical protein